MKIFTMNGAQLQAACARRRDADEMKFQKTKEVDKYFNKWNKITTRYEQWTAPQYYKLVKENYKSNEERKLKSINLGQRRENLRIFLDKEKVQYEKELNELAHAKNRRVPIETLKGVRETFQRTEEERRRLELEGRLYKKWRYGFCEDSVLLEAKSNHEALAKMNWMDIQIGKQLEKERITQEDVERKLRLQQEVQKHEELLSNRKVLYDEEVNELKSFQAKHMNELKLREKETETLHLEEAHLHQSKNELNDDLTKMEIHVAQRTNRIDCPHNLRRIKMFLRDQSDAIRKDLRFDIDLLDRITHLHHNNKQIQILRDKFEMQYDLEIQKQTQIEAMYESEAKMLLQKQQEIWLKESLAREKQLKSILIEQMQQVNNELDYVEKRLNELVDVRDCHRKAIENANERIKCIQNKDNFDQNDVERITNLNSTELESQFNSAMTWGTEDYAQPKFGRKKVAWT